MTKLIHLVILIGVFFSFKVFSESPQQSALVLYCHDGDTCRIKINDSIWLNVRLAGVDAPEIAGFKKKDISQPLGVESRDFLNILLKDKTVSLRQIDLDIYNRPVVEIFFEKQLVNTLLLEKGLSEVYQGKTKRLDKPQYISSEEKAKKAKIGIWGLKDYTSPKEFRNKNKK